jgi:hypothetical protein
MTKTSPKAAAKTVEPETEAAGQLPSNPPEPSAPALTAHDVQEIAAQVVQTMRPVSKGLTGQASRDDSNDFVGLLEYQSKLFVATKTGLYKKEGGKLVKVPLEFEE